MEMNFLLSNFKFGVYGKEFDVNWPILMNVTLHITPINILTYRTNNISSTDVSKRSPYTLRHVSKI